MKSFKSVEKNLKISGVFEESCNVVHEGKYGLCWVMWYMMGVLVILGNVVHEVSIGSIG